MTTYHRKKRSRLALNLIIVAAIIAGGIFASSYTQYRLLAQTDGQFETDTKNVTQLVLKDVESYNNLLYNARAYVENSQNVTQSEWDNYFKSQNTFERNLGISALYYTEIVQNDDLPARLVELKNDPNYGSNFSIRPAGEREKYGVTTLTSSTVDLTKSQGFDVFSTPDRLATYEKATSLNRPVASAPFKLDSGMDGFFVTLPVFKDDINIGYVGASFRTKTFIDSIYAGTSDAIATRISDVTDQSNKKTLFESDNWASTKDELSRTDTISFGEKSWELTFKSVRAYGSGLFNQSLPILILMGSAALILLVLLAHIRHERLVDAKHAGHPIKHDDR